ncbi:MAG TPA: zinc dependent phospholipase C family protein, partial [Gemmatimonadales bacterium]
MRRGTLLGSKGVEGGRRQSRAVAAVLAVFLLGLFLAPDSAWAWTPGTHIWLGESILANLHLLPASVSDLLHAFPYDFLYGSIAPDISFAKRYVPPGRHSHFWHVGQEVYADAPSDAMKAFGLGYLAHLSADTMAHNF